MKLFRTKTFIKDYRKVRFSDTQYAKYIEYLSLLLKQKPLPIEARNHNLTGNYADYKEFHIGGDLLVVYLVKDKIIRLARIGTHSQIFK